MALSEYCWRGWGCVRQQIFAAVVWRMVGVAVWRMCCSWHAECPAWLWCIVLQLWNHNKMYLHMKHLYKWQFLFPSTRSNPFFDALQRYPNLAMWSQWHTSITCKPWWPIPLLSSIGRVTVHDNKVAFASPQGGWLRTERPTQRSLQERRCVWWILPCSLESYQSWHLGSIYRTINTQTRYTTEFFWWNQLADMYHMCEDQSTLHVRFFSMNLLKDSILVFVLASAPVNKDDQCGRQSFFWCGRAKARKMSTWYWVHVLTFYSTCFNLRAWLNAWLSYKTLHIVSTSHVIWFSSLHANSGKGSCIPGQVHDPLSKEATSTESSQHTMAILQY